MFTLLPLSGHCQAGSHHSVQPNAAILALKRSLVTSTKAVHTVVQLF